ncbi:MAG: hypothetical protein LBB65_05260 [Burkholderiales bacterium]|nr:hypothetical protein [Burkholderiales bacterium]
MNSIKTVFIRKNLLGGIFIDKGHTDEADLAARQTFRIDNVPDFLYDIDVLEALAASLSTKAGNGAWYKIFSLEGVVEIIGWPREITEWIIDWADIAVLSANAIRRGA